MSVFRRWRMVDLAKLDVRTVQRYLAKGVVTRKEYDVFLASLPDASAESEHVDYETQFKEEAIEAEAQRRVEEELERAVEARAVVEPEILQGTPGKTAPPATVAPAEVAPSAVAHVPTAPKTPTPSGG